MYYWQIYFVLIVFNFVPAVSGTPQKEDVLIYTEENELFSVSVRKSIDNENLIVSTESIESTEEYLISLKGVSGGSDHCKSIRLMKCVQTRAQGLRYEIETRGNTIYAVTNHEAPNGKLIVLQHQIAELMDSSSSSNLISERCYVDVQKYDPNVEIADVSAFERALAVFGRKNGLPAVWVLREREVGKRGAEFEWSELSFPDDAFSVHEGPNYEYDSESLRITYSSLITPKRVIDVAFESLVQRVVKESEVPGYDKSLYECKRVFATAFDGARIPVTLVYLKSARVAGIANPMMMIGYGSYGICKDPSFDYSIIPLLNRGIVFGIAHIRGGGEMGRYNWYETGGKYLTKVNTFTDFISCCKHAIKEGITTSSRLAILGRSAGGLLMGAVINMEPSLCRAAVADVPFVDV